jgi:hypothetical protein
MKLRFVTAASATPNEPTAHPLHSHCGHTRHVGTCPTCQRVAQQRSQMQLAAAVAARETWARRSLSARRGLPARAA